MRSRGDVILLATALAVAVALSLARPQPQEQPSIFSSFDTGRNGYRAIYEVMRRERVATGRFQRELGTLHRFSGTMVVSANFFTSIAIGPADVRRLALLARGGARLVLLGEPNAELSHALALPAMRRIAAAGIARAAAGPLTRPARRVAAHFTTAFAAKRGMRVLLVARHRPVGIAYALGRGSVIAITAPDAFSNLNLGSDDNAWFAYDVLSARPPALFAENFHGYVLGTSMWAVLPATVHDAFWIATAILLLAVTGAMFRSAPPVALEQPHPRDSSAYLTAMASLVQRARAGSAAIERFVADAGRLARNRRRIAARPEVVADLEALAALQSIERPNDAAVLSAARIYARVRKEFVG